MRTVSSSQSFARRSQRGVGIFGILFVLIVLAFVGVVGMQTLPTVMEYAKIQKAVEKASRDGADPATIRSAFDKISTIDDFGSVTGKDLIFKKLANDKYQVSFAYEKEIPIYKPVYLVIKYAGESK